MELKLKGTSILWRIFSHLIVFYIIVKLCNHYLNLNLESLFEPIDPEVSEEIELTTVNYRNFYLQFFVDWVE